MTSPIKFRDSVPQTYSGAFWKIYFAYEIKTSEMQVSRWKMVYILNLKYSGNFCILPSRESRFSYLTANDKFFEIALLVQFLK